MAHFEYGPVELILIGFEGERPSSEVIDAVSEIADAGTVRVLDLVFISRAADGSLEIVEVEDTDDGYGFVDIELDASGLASSEDIDEIAGEVQAGTSAILLVVELVFAKKLSQSVFAAGGSVLFSERIPAPIVNASLDAADAAPAE